MPAQPFEIVVSPATVFLAEVGTEFPDVSTDPKKFPSDWQRIGTGGNLNYDDGGVTVGLNQTLGTFSGAGSTAVRKGYRTNETCTVSFSLVDLSPDQLALVLGRLPVNKAKGSGASEIEGLRGPVVTNSALLLRCDGPKGGPMQLQIPAAYESGNASPVLSKTGPAMIAVQFESIQLTEGELYQWVMTDGDDDVKPGGGGTPLDSLPANHGNVKKG